jgi:uncharacterized FlaG/YvyC family protein
LENYKKIKNTKDKDNRKEIRKEIRKDVAELKKDIRNINKQIVYSYTKQFKSIF